MGLVPAIRLVLISGALYLCLFLLGLLSREELAQSTMQTSLANAQGVVSACEPNDVPADATRALVVYLAIEDYFRPKVIRELEFFVARLSAYAGFEAVKTIGIGQISKRRFESVRGAAFGAERQHVWINKLRDDCENVKVLGELAKIDGETCDGAADERNCALQRICLWHANHLTQCFKDEKHLRYIQGAALWYEALTKINLSSQRPARNIR